MKIGANKLARPGHCFEDTFCIHHNGWYDELDAECLLVHGYPHLTDNIDSGHAKGTPFGHAWLEIDLPLKGFGAEVLPCVIDPLYGFTDHAKPMPRKLYYMVGEIEEADVRRYTKREARQMTVEHKHYGIWHDGPEGAIFTD
jgi:hypothetical protein